MHNGLLKDKLAKIMFAEKLIERFVPLEGLSITPTNLCVALYYIHITID